MFGRASPLVVPLVSQNVTVTVWTVEQRRFESGREGAGAADATRVEEASGHATDSGDDGPRSLRRPGDVLPKSIRDSDGQSISY